MKPLLLLFLCIGHLSGICQSRLPIYLRAEFGPSNVKTASGKADGAFAYGIGAETFVGFQSDGMGIGVNPALMYTKTGYETTVGGEVKVNYIHLSLPLVLSLNGFGQRKETGMIFGAGPYFASAAGGRFRQLITEDFRDMSFGDGTADNRRKSDAGISLKGAIRAGRTFLGWQYNYGLSNVIPKERVSNGEYIRTRNFLFYVAVGL